MKMLAAVLVLTSTLAVAQSVPAADIEQAWLDPSARGSLWVGNGTTLGRGRSRVGISASYLANPLRAEIGPSPLVTHRFGMQVFGALGLTDWLEVSALVPAIVSQQGQGGLQLAQAGLANPWLHVKGSLLPRSASVSLAVDLGLGLPLGTAQAQGNGGVAFAPKVQLGRVFDAFQLAAELGALIRPLADYHSISGGTADLLGSQWWLAGAITSVQTSGPRAEFGFRVNGPMTGAGRAGLELQVGVRWLVGPVELFATGGPGFFGEPNTPTARVALGAAFSDAPMTQPPCVEGQSYELPSCPTLDRDGDGVINSADQSPLAAEDRDGFKDEDGIPDPDNDDDGSLDADDQCRDVAGPAENRGCPDVDSDGDGVVDRVDSCPREAEDVDQFEDRDGCPDPDNDRDGFVDAADACPLHAGIAAEHGCPAKDSDGDGAFDHLDHCPSEAGARENRGCPATKPQVCTLTETELKLDAPLEFTRGKPTLTKPSTATLDALAPVLVAHPERRFEVVARADERPNAEENRKLAQARADALKARLVTLGVATAQLQAIGQEGAGPVVFRAAP